MLIFCLSILCSESQAVGQNSNIGTELIYDLDFDEKSIVYHHLYIIYNNEKIENYFLISGFEKNKIKFDNASNKLLSNLEEHLKNTKSSHSFILFKTTEYCLKQLNQGNRVSELFSKENGACNRFSTFEDLGKTSFLFWLKKIYFTYRDFVDWL